MMFTDDDCDDDYDDGEDYISLGFDSDECTCSHEPARHTVEKCGVEGCPCLGWWA